MTKSRRIVIQRFLRRCICAFISILYLFSATNIIYIALDWVAPLVKVVYSTDFPCAAHDCGCKTAEQCLSNCCCVSTGHMLSAQRSSPEDHCAKKPITVEVTYISAAQCSGHHLGNHNVSFQKTGPHLCVRASFVMPLSRTDYELVENDFTPPLVFVDSPDKIPI